ncbi:MAG: DUF4271 domain-containing protein [Bacteroidaceae bacterium]|nr:DUF4271 domain-containing protein [Bacteroidaceae bacterium]
MNDTLAMAWVERVQGIPDHVPLYADDLLVALLLGCFFVMSAVLSDKEEFLGGILKGFFLPREDASGEAPNTVRALYMRLGMLVVSFLSVAVLISAYVLQRVDLGLSIGALIMYSFVALLVLYVAKQGLYWIVNWTFFDTRRAELWRNCYDSWQMLSGVLAYLCALCVVFGDWSASTVVKALLVWLVLAEIGLFFKSFHIFLAKKYGGLQLFVYLCTLELIPLLFIGKALVLYV